MYKSNEEYKEILKEELIDHTFLNDCFDLKTCGRVERIMNLRLQDLQAIKEMVEGMIVNTPDEVAELNKHLPNPLAEYAYNNAVGYCKAIEDIKVKLDELMK